MLRNTIFMLLSCAVAIARAQTPIIFVHGAYEGPSAWNGVVSAFESATQAYSVTVVALPGHPGDPTNTDPNTVTFEDYVITVENAINAASGPVVLVGHSMAGLINSQVAENMPSKILGLIYYAAYHPKSGDTLVSSGMMDPGSVLAANVITVQNTTRITNATIFYNAACDLSDPTVISAINTTASTMEPLQPQVTPVTLGNNYASVPKYSVVTLYDIVISTNFQFEQISQTPNQEMNTTIAGPHAALVCLPNQLAADILTYANDIVAAAAASSSSSSSSSSSASTTSLASSTSTSTASTSTTNSAFSQQKFALLPVLALIFGILAF